MSSTSRDRRARRRAAREAGASGGGRSGALRWLVPGVIVAAVAIAAVLAFVLPGTNSPNTGASSSVAPSSSSTAGGGSGYAALEPTISGSGLPDFQNPNDDPAVGLPAPEVSGSDFSGKTVGIKANGRPKVVMFLAHWCPHCQAEVPLVQTWVSAGAVPQGVDVVSVATGIDPSRPNYPPDAWLEREGWTVPTIVDPSNQVAKAYGLAAYPFWVFIGADGKVAARARGEMTIPDLEAAIGRLTAG